MQTQTNEPAATAIIPTSTKTTSNTPKPTATQQPATETPTQTLTVVEAAAMTPGMVHFDIPAGLATGSSTKIVDREEWPAVNPSLGPFAKHWVVTLTGYSVRNSDIAPEIIIFRTVDFADLFPDIIAGLQQVKNHPGGAVPQVLLASYFCSKIDVLESGNGTGVRYLTQFFMSYFPVNNKDMYYYYAGLSADGAYYISMQMPATAAFLPADSNTDTKLPDDGITFPQNVDKSSFLEYITRMNEKVNQTDASAFKPSLLLLDDLARSVRIG
jgi:hypothetical protein